MVDLGFCEQIEGLLGVGNYVPELLIILREPHEKDNGENQIFWFKGEVEKKYCGQKTESAGTRFCNIYTILANKILEIEDEFVLHKCAYMNLHPFFGGKTTGVEFGSVLKQLEELSLETCAGEPVDIWRNREASDVAKHRIQIIQRAIDCGVKNIITTEDIYSVIKKQWKGRDEKTFDLEYKKNNHEPKTFHVCWLGKNKETRLISFRHPSYPSISYECMKNMQIP